MIQNGLDAEGNYHWDVFPVFEPLLRPARYQVAHGGRGSGKSHFFAEKLVTTALRARSIGGLRFVCVREVQRDLEQSAKRLIEDKVDSMGVRTYFDVRVDRIVTPGDGLVIFRGMQDYTSESIKSLEGYHGVWAEEARSLSLRSLDLLRPTIRVDPNPVLPAGSELWFSYNPFGQKDAVDQLFRGEGSKELIKSGDANVVQANWYNNPLFPEVLRKEKDRDLRRDPDKYAHVWLGDYAKRAEARVFNNWEIEEFETPDNVRFYFGGDWGYSVDPSVLIRCFIIERTLYVDQEVYGVGIEIDYLPALFAGDDTSPTKRWVNPNGRYKGIPGSLRWPIVADSARPETISYMSRRGFNIKPAKKGAGSVEDGIEFLRSFDIKVHPRCRHTIDELSTYSWKVDKRTDEILPVLDDKGNHVIDALRYAVESLLRKGVSMVNYL